MVAVVALMPATAQAATPLTVGSGHKPGLALDAAGTAYIAWYGPESNTTSLRFCRLPRGAAGCDAEVAGTIAAPGTTLSRPFVTVEGSTVRVVSYRYGLSGPNFAEVWEFISTNRGASFDAGSAIGYPPFDEGVVGPGNTLSVATNAFSEGLVFQNMPLAGGSAGSARAVLSGDHPYNGTVGLIDANTPLVVYSDGASFSQFRRYSGNGPLNDVASWTAPVDIGYADYPRLAGGPAGLFLLAGTQSSSLVVRKWNGTTFSAGVTIADSGDDAQDHLTQDPAGRLQAVFPRGAADGLHLMHAVSDDGANWQSGSVLTQADGGIGYLRAAAAPDHVGVAVWETGTSGGPEIRIAGIGPGAPASAQPIVTPVPITPSTPLIPVFHKTVVVKPVSGKILVRLLGTKRFVAVTATRAIPLGSTLDARRGVLQLSSAPKPGGAPQTAQFRAGMFKVTQPGSVTSLALTEPLRSCTARSSAAAAKKPKTRRLWGDGSGSFRTRGRYSAATVRGTRWLVQDSCAGTLTRVLRGVVSVRDSVRRRTIIVRAGKRYLARARR